MNEIHPTAIISPNVSLGKNNKILPNTIIDGPTKIGDNNIIGPHVVIGSPGQDTRNPRYDSTESFIEIGNNNIIREFTAIQKPCYENITKVGSNVFLMQSVHIPHDAIIQDHVVITPMCALAGITRVLRGASISMGVTIQQRVIVGHYSMVAMGVPISKNLRPFSIYVPGKPLRVNYYSVKKFGFQDFKNEIKSYVIDNKNPKSKAVLNVVREYQNLHKISKNSEY